MNNECKLQLLDLYFEKSEFSQTRADDNSEYNSSFEINYAINSADETKIRVTINTIVSNKTDSISVVLKTIGIFRIEKCDMDEETYTHLMKANTVAIIFPFIRSQISLLTTQPGIKPVIIPPININALIESNCEKD